MNREEYLKGLDKYLKRLPKKDYESAMEHFREYFEEAGEEGTQEVIAELGTPKEAAAEVLRNLLQEGSAEDLQERKEGKRHIGRGILIAGLAVMAAPIGLPLAAVAILMLLVAVLMAAVLVLCVFVLSLSLVCIGIKLLIRGIAAIFVSAPGALMICGIGLLAIGCSILSAILAVYLARWLSTGVMKFSGKIISKRRR